MYGFTGDYYVRTCRFTGDYGMYVCTCTDSLVTTLWTCTDSLVTTTYIYSSAVFRNFFKGGKIKVSRNKGGASPAGCKIF